MPHLCSTHPDNGSFIINQTIPHNSPASRCGKREPAHHRIAAKPPITVGSRTVTTLPVAS